MTRVRIRYRPVLIVRVVILAVCLNGTAPFVSGGIKLDYLMSSDPEIRVPDPVQEFDPAMSSLWMQALARPEIDMQRMAAETIARAHELGIPDLAAAVPRLETILLDGSAHLSARFAAARALIVLDSRSSSDKLFQASQTFGADMRQLIEPALADWGNESAKAVWVERLTSSRTRHRDLLLALRGLGRVREPLVLPDLLAMAGDLTRTPGCRIEAATAAGLIAPTGLEDHAIRLAENSQTAPFTNQVCALRFLAGHESESARQLLIKLASHDEPAVASSALTRLNEIDFSLVLPLAEAALRNSDSEIRRQGAISMLQRPTVDRISPLSQLLADPHPGLRSEVSEELLRLSEDPELEGAIREGAMRILSGDSWEGQEQAALLLGSLEHKPAAARLVELLVSPRTEVSVTVAWALRKVAVRSTIPGMLANARDLTAQGQHARKPGVNEQCAHLFEGLAVLNAKDAEPLLMEYVPKRQLTFALSRSAAIWAIGRLNTGVRNSEIESALAERLMDFAPRPSESELVKGMCAIALARMQATDQASMLRQYAMSEDVIPSDEQIRLKLTLGWAVKELTGEELPPPEPLHAQQESWFLEPLP
jgi:HEAT repeat protein